MVTMIICMKSMGKFYVLFTVLVALSIVKIDASLLTENYVTPNKTIGCSANQSQDHNCLTLKEYASQPDKYYANNTIFYFEPGNHTLNSSLKLENLHNFTFQGLPGSEQVSFLFQKSVRVTWENCRNIQVSSITFNLLGSFMNSIVFNQTQIVLLYDILVTGNTRFIGCSFILCQKSVVDIRNCNFTGIHGSLGAAMLILGSHVTFTGTNTFTDNTASCGGSLYVFNSVVLLSGANCFVHSYSFSKVFVCNHNLARGNQLIRGSGGAIFCELCTLIINHVSFFTDNFAQTAGGAIAAVDGKIIIQNSKHVFESNRAYVGGAMLFYNVTSILYGNVSFINNIATSGGALMMYFSVQSLGTNLLNFSGVEFGAITTVRYGRVASLVHGSNSSFVGTITLFGNVASLGGAIRSMNSEIIVENIYLNFINNTAVHGGAVFMAGTSKLILTPPINISFILNRANSKGGALYVKDSQCLLGSTIPIECFLSISNYATANISLLFLNNFAGFVGSTLYGGQLNKCRLYYGTNYSTDMICGNNDYRHDALGFFMNISKIDIQQNESISESATNISSQAEQVKFCHVDNGIPLHLKLHPGEQFNITVIALGQAGYPVPTTVFSRNINQCTDDDYILYPLSQQINGSCTSITFQLVSGKGNGNETFLVYPENPCQGLIDGLMLQIDILACPVGFELTDRRCICDSMLQNFTKRCIIRNFTKIFERTRNNFWISQTDTNTLIIHKHRCPLDYCKDSSEPVNVSLRDPSSSSVQCDFNRTGILCGQCQENFGLALGTLHCIPCNNNHSA